MTTSLNEVGRSGDMAPPINMDGDQRFYARPESLYHKQRLAAQSRFGNWRAFVVYEMDGFGENASIVSGVLSPTRAQLGLANEWFAASRTAILTRAQEKGE